MNTLRKSCSTCKYLNFKSSKCKKFTTKKGLYMLSYKCRTNDKLCGMKGKYHSVSVDYTQKIALTSMFIGVAMIAHSLLKN